MLLGFSFKTVQLTDSLEVRVSIYNLGPRLWHRVAEVFNERMGIYHVGVEVLGVEWSFGYCEAGSGVFAVEPTKCSLGPFKESVIVGRTKLSIDEIIHILHNLAPIWMGPDYNITQKNCVRFCSEFLHKLNPTLELPHYAASMSNLGAKFVEAQRSSKPIPNLTPEYLFGDSKEKRQMWIVAESIMKDYYSDLNPDPLSPNQHIHAEFPRVRHAKNTRFSMRHNPVATERRCIAALQKIHRNKYLYLNRASLRNLCH